MSLPPRRQAVISAPSSPAPLTHCGHRPGFTASRSPPVASRELFVDRRPDWRDSQSTKNPGHHTGRGNDKGRQEENRTTKTLQSLTIWSSRNGDSHSLGVAVEPTLHGCEYLRLMCQTSQRSVVPTQKRRTPGPQPGRSSLTNLDEQSA